MVPVVVVVFITETPQAVLRIGWFFDQSFYYLLLNLGEVLDIISLLSSVMNFTIYCTMSKKFRMVFKHHICAKVISKWNIGSFSLGSHETHVQPT